MVNFSTQANMHYMTGRIYYLENQIPQAIASFQKACELHPAGAIAQRAQTALNHLQSRNIQEIA
ncbi:MAG: tetratricopeptide repeat protein [Anaerolineae bacterium]|nr:tetratricopeptide repeat protein [Anaerolineae bacterium]